MRYMSTIYVSDVMDQVALTVEVQAWEGGFGAPETVYRETLVWPGIGETVPPQWLARVLFLAAEAMTTPPNGSGIGGAAMGGPHTLSGRGDRLEDVLG
jgi:hypothetical protein